MTDSTREMCQQHANTTREILEGIWAAVDADETYEGSDPNEYLSEWPLEIVWELGEPFAVVLGTGGPHIEITGGGRSQPSYKVDVYWSGEVAHASGEAITRAGEYFRSMVDENA